MQLKTLALSGGGVLNVCLRDAAEAMPDAVRRPMVVVVPGGGYNHVSPREGDPVALQFAAAGYHTAVLHYSVGEAAQDLRPLRQLNEAIGLLRANAEAWNILPGKIAVCGFSPGQFRDAGRQLGSHGAAAVWAGGSDHTADAAGLCLAYDGRSDRSGGEHPAADRSSAQGGRAL